MDEATLARLTHFAAGWEGASGPVSVSPADAAALEQLGARVLGGQVDAREMCAAVRKAASQSQPAEAPAPPALPAVSPNPEAGAPEEDGLDEFTVAELRQYAEGEGIALPAEARKAQIIETIRAAQKAKAPAA